MAEHTLANAPVPMPDAVNGRAARVDLESLPRARSIMLTGIFVLLLFHTLYISAAIAVPLVFAILLKLVLQPMVRLVGRARIPQPVAALAVIATLFGTIGLGAYALSGPATAWTERAPDSLPRLEQQLRFLARPIQQIQQATREVEKIAEAPGEASRTVNVRGPGLLAARFSGTRALFSGLFITVLMLFFLLTADDLFMLKLVEILPTFQDKKQAVAMSHEIEESVSTYLVTVTAMNLLVGLATTAAMAAIGLPDPMLWGALAFVLNYVLILGPLCGLAIFFFVGLLSFDALWQSLLPPAAYLAIHLVEGQAVTPMLLARRFTLNPVLVVGSLIFWNWMWGIPGALLAVPMLAVFKIVCDRTRPLAAIGHFLGG